MNRLELLFEVLAEEAAEISQIAIKNNRFGMNEICPGQPLTNAQRAHIEIDDLMAMIEILNDEYNFGYTPSRGNIENKKKKFNKYAEYSRQLGILIVKDDE